MGKKKEREEIKRKKWEKSKWYYKVFLSHLGTLDFVMVNKLG